MSAVEQLAETIPIAHACQVFDLSRATYYRAISPVPPPARDYPEPSNKLLC